MEDAVKDDMPPVGTKGIAIVDVVCELCQITGNRVWRVPAEHARFELSEGAPGVRGISILPYPPDA